MKYIILPWVFIQFFVGVVRFTHNDYISAIIAYLYCVCWIILYLEDRNIIGSIKVRMAYIANKQEDVHGRKYRDVYKKFGHKEMVKDYLSSNSWDI